MPLPAARAPQLCAVWLWLCCNSGWRWLSCPYSPHPTPERGAVHRPVPQGPLCNGHRFPPRTPPSGPTDAVRESCDVSDLGVLFPCAVFVHVLILRKWYCLIFFFFAKQLRKNKINRSFYYLVL